MNVEWLNNQWVVSIIGGAIGSLAIYFGLRWWSSHSIKSLKRKIERDEAYREHVTSLAKSDRALLIAGFEGVFFIGFGVFLIIFIQAIASAFQNPSHSDLPVILISFSFGGICFGLLIKMRQTQRYPESLNKLDMRITNLKNKFLSRQKNS